MQCVGGSVEDSCDPTAGAAGDHHTNTGKASSNASVAQVTPK